MSVLDLLTDSENVGYFAMAAGAVLFVMILLFFLARQFRTQGEEAEPPRPVKPKTEVKGSASRWGRTPVKRPPARPVDPEEAYLREHSVLPESPEVADGGSDPFIEGGTHERRSAPRRTGNPIDVLLSDAKAEVEPLAGIILDRSATGLALELWADGEVSPGTIICVRPRRASADSSWTRVVVRRCEKRRTSWVLGCEFVRPPGVNAMMEFG